MAISQAKSMKKQTGAKYKDYRKKKKHELGRTPTMTKLGERKTRDYRILGGNKKTFILNDQFVNLNGKDNKSIKVKITGVLENSANRHFVRRNILTKGTIINTEKGKAMITSRPGQVASLNAKLIE